MATPAETPVVQRAELKRSITAKQLYFYVVGDVLGSGIYVLVGLVAAAVGGAFWMAFLAGVAIAAITGLAYAELVTKYPQAAGASLYINKAFRSPVLTFFITICMLSANMAAVGSLSAGFVRYLGGLIGLPADAIWGAALLAVGFVLVITVINLIGITESVVANVVMTFIELSGLVIVVAIGIIAWVEGVGDPSVLLQFSTEGSGGPVLAVLAGVSLAFFAMTGFENAANVAEETINPSHAFPRALIGGMLTAGIVYVLVSIAAALAVPIETLAGNTLLEVIRADLFFIPAAVMLVVFGIIAMIAISNTALVTVVAQSRILFGMARENVVPAIFARIHPVRRSPYVALLFGAAIVSGLLLIGAAIRSSQAGIPADEQLDIVDRLATITVVFLLFIYALVIVACLKLRGTDETEDTYRANTPLLIVGILGNLAVLVYTLIDDPDALFWVAGLLAVGLVLYLLQNTFGKKNVRPPGTGSGTPESAELPPASKEL
jgi:APA family basic amino acid/polyamine antiporter